MSRNTSVIQTSKEYTLKTNALIVTKTDLKGHITYANEGFLNISLLDEKNTLTQSHNIIRHPDMPKAVFRLLWDTLKKGDEFFGVIKNMSSDGGYYWAFANITPSYDNSGKIIGYFSVQRASNNELINIIKNLYQEMLQAEKQQSNDKLAIEASSKILTDFMNEQGVSYNEYLISFA